MKQEDLRVYIERQLANGHSRDEVEQALLAKGWKRADIESAFAQSGERERGEEDDGVDLLPAAKLLGSAWEDYRDRIKVFVGIVAPPALLYLCSEFLTLIAPEEIQDPPMVSVVLGLLILSTSLLQTLVNFVSTPALFIAARDRTVSVRDAYRRALDIFLSYWWVALLVSLVTMGGTLLLIVPGIILSILLSQAPYVLVYDGVRGIAALQKSREYMRGIFWSVVWRQLFLGIILLPLSILFYYLLMPIPEQYGGMVAELAGILLFVPFIIIYGTKLFESIRITKGDVGGTRRSSMYVALAVLGLLVPFIVIAAIIYMIGNTSPML